LKESRASAIFPLPASASPVHPDSEEAVAWGRLNPSGERADSSKSMPFRLRTLAALVALLGPASPPNAAETITGTYDVAGTVHVSVSPFPAHDYPGELTATLSRTSAPGSFSLRLEARGYACTLPIRAGTDGLLQFPDGASCRLDVAQPEARGHLDAQLRTARARVVDARLEMALEFHVTGSMQLKIPSKTIRVLGAEVQTPATWAPSAPLRGTVAASGRGSRQQPSGR
jgi:hypothetical protein